MTSFLEYVVTRFLGRPFSTRGDGQSTWPCPRCGHKSFHTLPHNPLYRDRVRCWSCSCGGDVFDFLEVVAEGNYPTRRTIVDHLREEYERESAAALLLPPGTSLRRNRLIERGLLNMLADLEAKDFGEDRAFEILTAHNEAGVFDEYGTLMSEMLALWSKRREADRRRQAEEQQHADDATHRAMTGLATILAYDRAQREQKPTVGPTKRRPIPIRRASDDPARNGPR